MLVNLSLEPVSWQSYRDIDKDALPWDGTDVVRWRANRSFGTPAIHVIPTVHEGKYKGSTRIKLNAGVDWGKGVPYLSNPAKIFDNPRFVDIPPSTPAHVHVVDMQSGKDTPCANMKEAVKVCVDSLVSW